MQVPSNILHDTNVPESKKVGTLHISQTHQSRCLEKLQRSASVPLSALSVPPPPPRLPPVSAAVARTGVEKLSEGKAGEAGVMEDETNLFVPLPLT